MLNALAWPADSEEKFLRDWRAGKAKLPRIELHKRDLSENIAALEAIAIQCKPDDPVEKFLSETATSYADAARMLSAIGMPDFTRYSTRLYGRPDHVYKLQGLTPVDAVKFFLEITDDLLGTQHIPVTDFDIDADEFADWLQEEVDEFFEEADYLFESFLLARVHPFIHHR